MNYVTMLVISDLLSYFLSYFMLTLTGQYGQFIHLYKPPVQNR